MRIIEKNQVRFQIYDTHQAVCQALAEEIAEVFKLKNGAPFFLNLAGGTTIVLVEQFLTGRYKDKIDWQNTHLFWGDEHANRNNYRLAWDEGGLKTLVASGILPEKNVHPIMLNETCNLGDAKEIASEYEKEIEVALENRRFDLSIIGLGGTDFHTMSLLPQKGQFMNRAFYSNQLVEAVSYPGELYPKAGIRVTMTPHCLKTRSQWNVMLATGVDKSKALREIFSGDVNVPEKPGSLIRLLREPMIFADEAAAQLL